MFVDEHLKFSGNGSLNVPDIAELEKSIDDLKFDIESLNRSLVQNYGKSDVFLDEDLELPKSENFVQKLVCVAQHAIM